jgi:uncharacterized protein (DUF1501 family)
VLSRSTWFDGPDDRADVAAVLGQEAQNLVNNSYYTGVPASLQLQYASVGSALASNLSAMFDGFALAAKYPQFNAVPDYATQAAFIVDSMSLDKVRCVSLGLGNFDTHFGNYAKHAGYLQELFNTIALLLTTMDATPHPTLPSDKLSEHVHFLVTSDFCRTPNINVQGGRDHYPNNSCLVISPRFKGNTVIGQSDPAQLLPGNATGFALGPRPVAPPDVLATFVNAFGIDPSSYFRDGEVMKWVLA